MRTKITSTTAPIYSWIHQRAHLVFWVAGGFSQHFRFRMTQRCGSESNTVGLQVASLSSQCRRRWGRASPLGWWRCAAPSLGIRPTSPFPTPRCSPGGVPSPCRQVVTLPTRGARRVLRRGKLAGLPTSRRMLPHGEDAGLAAASSRAWRFFFYNGAWRLEG